MSKLIVVVGATGNQGSSVCKTFVKLPGWKVRGITRDPSKPSTKELKDAGVEFVAGDLDNVATLVKAFSGADAIFGVTDFWQFPSNPTVQAQAQSKGVQLNVACMEAELVHFKNIVDAAAEVLAREHKLERFVMSTLSDTKKWSKGEITQNYHFDGKAEGTEYLKTSLDPKLQALNAVTSWLQVGLYLDNWKQPPHVLSPKQQEDGSFVYNTIGQPPYTKPLPFVHPPTDTGPFTKALVEAPPQQTMLGTSGELSTLEYVDLLAQKFGQPLKIRTWTPDEMISLMGPVFGTEVLSSGFYSSKFGYDGGDPEVKRPWELGVNMEDVTTAKKYVDEQDFSPIML